MDPLTIALIFFGGIAGLVCVPIALGIGQALGIYTVVQECESHVYTLFGKVIGDVG